MGISAGGAAPADCRTQHLHRSKGFCHEHPGEFAGRKGRQAARREGVAGDWFDQRHRARGRPGAGGGRIGGSAQWSRPCRRDRQDERRARRGIRRRGRLFLRRHDGRCGDRRDDVRDARRAWPHRRAGQQCRHPVCRAARPVSGREMGRNPGDQSVIGVSHHPVGVAGDAPERLWADHQYRIRPWAGRLTLQGGVRRG